MAGHAQLQFVKTEMLEDTNSLDGAHLRPLIISNLIQTVPGRRIQNSVSFQCARGKSSNARKLEDHPKIFMWLKTFQKCNSPDFKFYPSKFTDKKFPHMVKC